MQITLLKKDFLIIIVFILHKLELIAKNLFIPTTSWNTGYKNTSLYINVQRN
ncbi:hypothetical protein GCW_90601 [Mycoplasmoides gallisepticum S6]|uniref:Uncharacterized protein n=1 Tax=Mycoplasmoides gallisepticum S6 TaxID=1006581 RepID=A0A0F6CLT9_MYCGL|nr:hypothetical protein GCW_90601 [Mycoplasmoides gallisepticum S6]